VVRSVTTRTFYRWTRDLHLYFGLYLCPFVVVFAVSTILLNHAWKAASEPALTTTFRALDIPAELEHAQGMERVRAAKKILAQVGATGEINFIRTLPKEQRMLIPVMKPGEETIVNLDLRAREAVVEVRQTGLGEALIYLHRSPGPHNVNIRGNWIFTRLWGWLADATVALVLFLSISGVYLWIFLKAERKPGITFMIAGVLSCAAAIYAIVRG
jgi:hypothetical protein